MVMDVAIYEVNKSDLMQFGNQLGLGTGNNPSLANIGGAGFPILRAGPSQPITGGLPFTGADALSIAFGFVGGAGSTQGSAKDKNLSGTIASSKRMADGKEWTTANLNVNTSSSYCYDDAELNCRRYGRLYTWESAQRGCQSLGGGWRLPTDDEWLT